MPGANAYGNYHGDAASSSIYGSSSNYGRTYLPFLPRRVKNKTLEHHRQALATSNEAYGNFWSTETQRRSRLVSAGLPSNHDVLDRTRLEGHSFLTSGYQVSPRPEELKLPAIEPRERSPHPEEYSPRIDLSQRLDFTPRKMQKLHESNLVLGKNEDDNLVAHFDPSTDLHMPDIKAIDITVHLKDDSSFVLKSMPFTCWDQLR